METLDMPVISSIFSLFTRCLGLDAKADSHHLKSAWSAARREGPAPGSKEASERRRLLSQGVAAWRAGLRPVAGLEPGSRSGVLRRPGDPWAIAAGPGAGQDGDLLVRLADAVLNQGIGGVAVPVRQEPDLRGAPEHRSLVERLLGGPCTVDRELRGHGRLRIRTWPLPAPPGQLPRGIELAIEVDGELRSRKPLSVHALPTGKAVRFASGLRDAVALARRYRSPREDAEDHDGLAVIHERQRDLVQIRCVIEQLRAGASPKEAGAGFAARRRRTPSPAKDLPLPPPPPLPIAPSRDWRAPVVLEAGPVRRRPADA